MENFIIEAMLMKTNKIHYIRMSCNRISEGLLYVLFLVKEERSSELHNEELRGLYSSSSTIRMIKSMTMRWAGHVAGMEIRGLIWIIGRKAIEKEATRKTKMYMDG
jgi:hypothetical protein